MLALYLLFYLIALVLFVFSASKVSLPRVNLLALGLAFWTLPPLLQVLQKL